MPTQKALRRPAAFSAGASGFGFVAFLTVFFAAMAHSPRVIDRTERGS